MSGSPPFALENFRGVQKFKELNCAVTKPLGAYNIKTVRRKGQLHQTTFVPLFFITLISLSPSSNTPDYTLCRPLPTLLMLSSLIWTAPLSTLPKVSLVHGTSSNKHTPISMSRSYYTVSIDHYLINDTVLTLIS